MDELAPYIERLQASAATTDDPRSSQPHGDVIDHAGPVPLRQLVSPMWLRENGVFFTSAALAKATFEPIASTIGNSSTVLDPACGAGDLLLAALPYITQHQAVPDERIVARDINLSFVTLAKLRLQLALRHTSLVGVSTSTFPNICVGDAASPATPYSSATHIVLNPPYTLVEAPEECEWASGKINAATVFLERSLQRAEPGTLISAILPDVLRSGSRYTKWRKMVDCHAERLAIELYGRFDSDTDVDVFMLTLRVCTPAGTLGQGQWVEYAHAEDATVSDYFTVMVGPVVEHRHPRQGLSRPYAVARDLPAWDTVDRISRRRSFNGRVFEPPIVVVRRTSRAGERSRARATIITGGNSVAVENHLLVLQPRNGTLDSCRELLHILRDRRTDQWLDDVIRCRHLTVGAVRTIPWWRSAGD